MSFARNDHKPRNGFFQFMGVQMVIKKFKQPYSTLHTDILKSTVVMFLAEILTMVLKEEAPNEGLYNYIETALLWFDTVDCNSIFHHQFLMGLTKYVGVSPWAITSSCFKSRFSKFDAYGLDI